MTDTPYTDKHASPWVPEPNTDWVPAYMVRELEREFNASKAEVERLRNELQGLKHAAQAVVDRWETPLWKDAEPTASVIYRLRNEIQKLKEAN
jgi:hypothetical protein